MLKINNIIIMLISLSSNAILCQTLELEGQVHADSDLEGIHVINKTSRFYTTTNKTGGFTIQAKLNDTLVFSSVQYKLLSIKINQDIIDKGIFEVKLEEFVNVLNEVLIGNTLTGNLEDDIKLSDAKPDINFYDVGIPGYTGKPKTQSERRLIEADHGKYFRFYGVGFVINVNKILNKASGRTDELKNRVALENKDELMFQLKAKFSEDLFSDNPLPEDKHLDFFYFCSDHPDFIETCSVDNDLAIFEFLKNQLEIYKSRLIEKD